MAKANPVSHWLMKSEPSTYAFERLVADGRTTWDGVRNFTARNNLRAMKKGDLVLFYHSNEGKAVVGIAKVAREAYADPTAKEGDWSAVEIEPVRALARPVPLDELRATKSLATMQVIKQSRLSVSAVTPEEYETILKLGTRTP